VKVTKSITRKKAQRRDVGRLKNGSIDLSYLSGRKATTQLNSKPTLEVKKNGSCLK
jgi:hypothetical protein